MPIPLSLSLAVALGGRGVCLPVALLIIGVLRSPFFPAVLDHLRVQQVGSDLLPVVVGTTAPLALRLAANALLESIRRWLENELAIGAAAARNQCGSSKWMEIQLRAKQTHESHRCPLGICGLKRKPSAFHPAEPFDTLMDCRQPSSSLNDQFRCRRPRGGCARLAAVCLRCPSNRW